MCTRKSQRRHLGGCWMLDVMLDVMLENGLFGKPVIIITLTTGDMHAGVQNCVSNAEQRDVLCREKMCEYQQKKVKRNVWTISVWTDVVCTYGAAVWKETSGQHVSRKRSLELMHASKEQSRLVRNRCPHVQLVSTVQLSPPTSEPMGRRRSMSNQCSRR
jgi:hypothetical protein